MAMTQIHRARGNTCLPRWKPTCAHYYNTPVQALARLRKMYRKDPTVRRLKPKWVQNYYNRNIKPPTPKLSIEALEEWMRKYTRDPPDTDCPHEDAFILHSERGLGDWLPSSIIHWMGLELPWKPFGS